MRCGRSVPRGFLPVFSVDTKEEAENLITLACKRNMRGELVAPELAEDQTLENLQAFSDRLDKAHDFLVERGGCACR